MRQKQINAVITLGFMFELNYDLLMQYVRHNLLAIINPLFFILIIAEIF